MRPVTVQLVSVVVVQWNDPGDDVTVYPVIGEPPFDEGAVQLTTDWEFSTVALTDLGAAGTVDVIVTIGSCVILNETCPSIVAVVTTDAFAPMTV